MTLGRSVRWRYPPPYRQSDGGARAFPLAIPGTRANVCPWGDDALTPVLGHTGLPL